jgi:hypothetical protein
MTATPSVKAQLTPREMHTLLPGPTRKRTCSPYYFRLTHSDPEPAVAGCVLLWEVQGGRAPYQIALERNENGSLRWHCTCADAVYRGETEGHVCKHVRALLNLGRRPAVPVSQAS